MRLGHILKREDNSLGLIRLIAAVVVIIDHCFELVHGPGTVLPGAEYTALSIGQHSVNVFFVLSGILVAASLDRSPTMLHYLGSRALRILPGLATCVLITALIVGPLFTNLASLAAYLLHPDVYLYILKTTSLMTGSAPLPGVFVDNPVAGSINVPLWTIKYEVVCYLVLALLAMAGVWRRRAFLAGGFAIFLIIYFVAMAHPGTVAPGSSLHWFLNLALAFSIGSAAYLARNKIPINIWLLIAVCIVYALALDTSLERPLTPILTGYVMLWIAQFRFGPLRDWTNKTDLSFGIYVYGWIVQQAVIATFPTLGVLPVGILVFTILIPIAWLSWTYVEKPALERRPELMARLEPIAVATRSRIDDAWETCARRFGIHRGSTHG